MNTDYFFNYLIQNKVEVIRSALKGELPQAIVRTLIVFSLLCLAVFGAMIGASHSILQAATSFIKLPVVFFITGLICFPTLYIFLSLFGFKTSLRGVAQFCLISVSIMGIILIAFAPISLFFLVVGTPYQVFKMINVLMMAISGISGIYIFDRYLMVNLDPEHPNKVRIKRFMRLWQVMYGVIGANLGFAISPIFGDPSVPFMFLSNANENFFTHIIHLIL